MSRATHPDRPGTPAGEDMVREEMVFLPGATFRMGSDRHDPEEAPVHRVTVDGFWIDRTPVTNARFRAFVRATGHVTLAERALRAGQIIRRLRDFVARGETERRVEPVVRLIEDACALAMVGAREQGVVLHLALDRRVGSVLADRVQIQQVLINLIRNAREAMAQGPRRELGIATRLLTPDRVEIAVSDMGPGIADEVVERLFQPFVSTKPGGMGLGLSICRTISEAHGGRLEVERNEAGGATFRLTLPAVRQVEPDHGGPGQGVRHGA